MDIAEEREMLDKYDPEEQEYITKLLDEVERLQISSLSLLGFTKSENIIKDELVKIYQSGCMNGKVEESEALMHILKEKCEKSNIQKAIEKIKQGRNIDALGILEKLDSNLESHCLPF